LHLIAGVVFVRSTSGTSELEEGGEREHPISNTQWPMFKGRKKGRGKVERNGKTVVVLKS
jgi:hypothetical protein